MKNYSQNKNSNKTKSICAALMCAALILAAAMAMFAPRQNPVANGGGWRQAAGQNAATNSRANQAAGQNLDTYGGIGQGEGLFGLGYAVMSSEFSLSISTDTDSGKMYLSWTFVEGAAQYVIKLGSQKIGSITGRRLSMEVTGLLINGGAYDFSVFACSEIDDENSVIATATLLYEHFITLKVNGKARFENGLLKWNGVANATSYKVISNGVIVGNPVETQFDLYPRFGDNRDYHIQILCVNNSENSKYFKCELNEVFVYTRVEVPLMPLNVTADSMGGGHYISWEHTLIKTYCAIVPYNASGEYPDAEYILGLAYGIDITAMIVKDGEYVALVKAMDGPISSKIVTCRFLVENGEIVGSVII